MIKPIVFGAAALLLLSNVADAAKQFYRYKNENGNPVLSNTIPKDKLAAGYEIVDAKGRVIKTVGPALTEDELAEKTEQRKQAALEKERAAKQAEVDAELLRKYSFPEDIEAEKDRKIKEMQVNATILQGNLKVVQGELEAEYAKAAKLEKNNQPVSKALQNRISALESKLKTTQVMLDKRESEVTKAENKYDESIARFKELQEQSKNNKK